MISDRQLSANFWLHEFPCWERASERDVASLRETVQRVLQPTRNRWGPVVPTSWMRWKDGCTPRTGSHAHGGTVDFTVVNADLRDVFSWGVQELLPAGYLGRWIYEPERASPRQGEHIHAAPRVDMIAAFDVSDIGAFEEQNEGQYIPAAGPFPGPFTGAFGDPIPLPPLYATAPANLGRWLLLGAVVGTALAQMETD